MTLARRGKEEKRLRKVYVSSSLELTVEGEREWERVRMGEQERSSERDTRADNERAREPAREIY